MHREDRLSHPSRTDAVNPVLVNGCALSAAGAVAIEALLGLVQYPAGAGQLDWVRHPDQPPYGIFQQLNVMASFMATGLSLAIWLELRGDASPWLKGLRYGVI